MARVVIFGTGAVATEVYFEITHAAENEVVAFTVDSEYMCRDDMFGKPIIPFDQIRARYGPDEYQMHIALGYIRANKLRAERFMQAKEMGYELVSCISARAITSLALVAGENCFIGAGSVIAPCVEMGDNVYVGVGSIIGHHTKIGDHCFLAAGVLTGGYCSLEPFCFLGMRATIRNKIRIAPACVIGAGALILGHTKENEVYMGEAANLLSISSEKLPLA